MIKQFRERRHCHPYMPYIFFGLELIIYGELAYLIYFILGSGKPTYVVIALVFIYQLTKSTQRLIYVKKRCKSAESYRKFQKKVHEKMLKEALYKKKFLIQTKS